VVVKKEEGANDSVPKGGSSFDDEDNDIDSSEQEEKRSLEKRYSNPQAGKSACDRYAAVIKGNIRRYLNGKHNVTNAAEFVEACHSYNGVKGVQAFECHLLRSEKESTATFPKITSVNNFRFEKNGIRVHRTWKVGGGKLIPWKDLKWTNILDELVFRTINTTSHIWVYRAKRETKKESAKAISSVTKCLLSANVLIDGP
ncbi:unnamed protein product, partial [Didymodactylos carnosus]